MPCYHTGSAEGDLRESLDDVAKERDLLENMLCGLCTRVEAAKFLSIIYADPTLKTWWAKHKLADQREKATEAADEKRSALAAKARKKLTKAEKEALGIR